MLLSFNVDGRMGLRTVEMHRFEHKNCWLEQEDPAKAVGNETAEMPQQTNLAKALGDDTR
jgi:hypothetical protein